MFKASGMYQRWQVLSNSQGIIVADQHELIELATVDLLADLLFHVTVRYNQEHTAYN
jgi:hypothetical protein